MNKKHLPAIPDFSGSVTDGYSNSSNSMTHAPVISKNTFILLVIAFSFLMLAVALWYDNTIVSLIIISGLGFYPVFSLPLNIVYGFFFGTVSNRITGASVQIGTELDAGSNYDVDYDSGSDSGCSSGFDFWF